jgi:hypothetical protein
MASTAKLSWTSVAPQRPLDPPGWRPDYVFRIGLDIKATGAVRIRAARALWPATVAAADFNRDGRQAR